MQLQLPVTTAPKFLFTEYSCSVEDDEEDIPIKALLDILQQRDPEDFKGTLDLIRAIRRQYNGLELDSLTIFEDILREQPPIEGDESATEMVTVLLCC